MFGKGMLSVAVLGASFAAPVLGAGLFWPALVTAVGGTLLTIVDRVYRQHQYQDRMVDVYRDDIATQLGLDPQDITRSHLKIAAKDNDVIDQALKRQRVKTIVAIGTAAIAGFSTFFLVNSFGTAGHMHDWAVAKVGPLLGSLANYIGIGTIAGIVGLVANRGLRTVINAALDVRESSAHDNIMRMEFDIKNGRTVTKEQVYAVVADANPKLRHTIHKQFRESYDHMSPAERSRVLDAIGVAPEMQALADDINQRTIQPARLAYMLQDATHGAREPIRAPEHRDAPHGGFVERLNLAARPQQSFREQVAADRTNIAERSL
jgi:hypothetical protein